MMDFWLLISIILFSTVSIILFTRFTYNSLKKRLSDYTKESKQYFSTIESRYIKPIYFDKTTNNNIWFIIISYNRKEMLKNLIDSLKQNEPEVKILVVDNGSNPDLLNFLAEYLNSGKIDRVLFNNHDTVPQWQKSYALYQAFQLLKVENPEYIGWIDDDILVKRSFLDLAKRVINELKHKGVKVVSLIDDEHQDKVHRTIEKVIVDNREIKLTKTFCGMFVIFKSEILNDLGLPPVNEGINDLEVEDWYYSRMLEYSDSRAAAFEAGIHLGYKTSIRESIS